MIKLEGLDCEQINYRATAAHKELTKEGKPNQNFGKSYHMFNLADGTKFNSDSDDFLAAYKDGSLFTVTLKSTKEGLAEVTVWKTRKQIEALHSNEEYKRKVRGKAPVETVATVADLVAGS